MFGIFAGLNFWFPKIAGFRLNERIGRYAVWGWLVGFFVAFTPLYILGLMGATRRLDQYDASRGWQPFFIVSLIGGVIIMIAVALQVVQIIASFMQRRHLVDTTGDPWDGRNLEWSTTSTPPIYNFAIIPEVTTRDAFWEMKQSPQPKPQYVDIHMPKNTASGIYISALAFLAGFGFVWHINWLAVLSMVGIVVVLVVRLFDEDTEYTIPAAVVEEMEKNRAREIESLKVQQKPDQEDMGLIEFAGAVSKWALGLVRRKP